MPNADLVKMEVLTKKAAQMNDELTPPNPEQTNALLSEDRLRERNW
ncbi:hypothetical protein GXM_07256 [Nostoc sphaeroides CCNUC1]|uniref:Uncharacterized protein n=1 Tax=Nostoc sphaeroides CCNUC1 TaxID=2653204 RepID=A0A5P8WAZ6_9NOSO|nr:hypothetical protein GXM_07256 [Nostoc sphaeroides CCNUC1]